jgi:predicted Zn-dependent peptidase
MKNKMRNIIYTISFFICLFSYSQFDRSKIPSSGPSPEINLGEPTEYELKNGLKIILVQNSKLPRVFFNLFIDSQPIFEGEKAGISSITSSLIGKGTKNISKDKFLDEIDFMGANLSLSATGAFGSSLSKFFPKLLDMTADGLFNPVFDIEEFTKSKERLIEGIKSDENSVPAAARRVANILAYGKNHPISEYPTEKSINNIEFDDIEKFFKSNFKPNNSYMVVVGDFDIDATIKQIEALFKKWKKGKVTSSKFLSNSATKTAIHFIDMPNAIQSEISFQNLINLKKNNPDYFSLLITNKILGGGAENRLEQQIRENKGYTYVARSTFGTSKYVDSRFRAFTNTREQVTDSAVFEILNEIKKIKNFNVEEKELEDVKAKYFGDFVLATEGPSTIANYAVQIKTQNLGKDFYKNYLSNINSISIEQVRNTANKYFDLENGQIIIAGKGSAIADKLENIEFNGKKLQVYYYDKYGNSVEKPVFKKEISDNITVKNIFENHLNAIGGVEKLNSVTSISITAAVTIPGAPFKPNAIIKEKFPNKSSMEMSVPNMGTLMTQKFNGEDGYIEQMGQKIPYEDDQKTEQKEKKGLFEEIYLDDSVAQIVSLSPVDGKDIYKVQIKENSFRFYEADTGLLIMTEETTVAMGNEIKTITKFSDYREIDGVKYAFKREIITGPQTIVIEADQVILNEEIADDFFN